MLPERYLTRAKSKVHLKNNQSITGDKRQVRDTKEIEEYKNLSKIMCDRSYFKELDEESNETVKKQQMSKRQTPVRETPPPRTPKPLEEIEVYKTR